MTTLQDHPPLSIDGPVKDAYLLLIGYTKGPAACSTLALSLTRDRGAVRRAEQQTGLRLEGPLLLLFSEASALDRYDFDLDQLAAYRQDASEADVPAELVPIGRNQRSHHRCWICVERDSLVPDVVEYSETTHDEKRQPLDAWLAGLASEALEIRRFGREEIWAIDKWAHQATLEIRWERVENGQAHSLARVRHAKFGIGVVRREETSGEDRKLEIDFGPAGVRVLLERFVERIS